MHIGRRSTRLRQLALLLLVVVSTAQAIEAPRAQDAPDTAHPIEEASTQAASTAPTAAEATPSSSSTTADSVTGAETATEATAPAESTPPSTAPPGRRRIIVLPIEYSVKQLTAGRVLETVPEWTSTARTNILSAANTIVGGDSRFELGTVPSLAPEEQKVLDEHIELFKILASDVSSLLKHGGKAWYSKKKDFDYSLGNGLAFLRGRADADVALLISGVQIEQSGGSIMLQLLAAGAAGVAMGGSGGTYISAGIVDLDTGNVYWFNSIVGMEVLGISAKDLRSPETASRILHTLIDPYPKSPFLEAADPPET